MEDRPFAKSTLQVFRAGLILHDKVREVFERSLQLARESGYLKGKRMRMALDTTNILGRGAVKDTYNLLSDGIVRLVRALAQLRGISVGEWAKSQGHARRLASSVKGEAAIDWADRQARAALLAGIVEDADRLLELSRQAQGELAEDSAERQRIVAASELLGQLLLQDVERTEGGADLRDGVSRDRILSVHDPEMRHGHKSSSRRFDGHKAAVVVDTDSQLITAVDVLPGNAADSLGALELVEQSEASAGIPVEEAMGDAAYGGGKLARPSPTRDAGWGPRRQGVPTGLIFPRTTSVLTWSRAPAPVRRGMSPEPCCQRGNGTVIWIGPIVSSDSMRRFVERAHCGPSALRRDRAQAGRCGYIPRNRYCSRPTPYSRVRPLPNTVDAVWSLSIGWRGWSSSESASPATSDAPRHYSSCTWRPRSLI